MTYIGIDLGSQGASAAFLRSSGVPTLTTEGDTNAYRRPSDVLLANEIAVPGSAAAILADDTGSGQLLSNTDGAFWTSGAIHRDAQNRDWSGSAVAAIMLRRLVLETGTAMHSEVGGVVLTAAGHHTAEQRSAIKLAARLAGVRQVVLVEDAEAAACAFVVKPPDGARMLVLDYGEASFRATLLTAAALRWNVTARGVSLEGGIAAFSRSALIAGWVDRSAPEAVSAVSACLATPSGRRIAHSFGAAVASSAAFRARRLFEVDGAVREACLGPAGSAQVAVVTLRGILEAVTTCLRTAEVTTGDLAGVVVCGGGGSMPMLVGPVLNALAVRCPVHRGPHPELSATHGAAVLAARMSAAPMTPDAAQVSADASGIGVAIMGPEGTPTIDVLVPFPTSTLVQGVREYTAMRPDQRRFIFQVVHRDREAARPLGVVAFGPIESPRVGYPVRLRMEVDPEGLLDVHVEDPTAGATLTETYSVQKGVDGPPLNATRRRVADFEA